MNAFYLFLDKVMLTPTNRRKLESGISVKANGKMSIFIEVIREISAEQRLLTLDMANRIGVKMDSFVCSVIFMISWRRAVKPFKRKTKINTLNVLFLETLKQNKNETGGIFMSNVISSLFHFFFIIKFLLHIFPTNKTINVNHVLISRKT